MHNGFRGEREEKRAVKHGKSGLRTAICALFGTSRGDLCKTVEKLCKSLQGVKTKNTNCAQRFVRLCVLVRELCKYRFLSAFGVWALWCGGAPFGRFPSRLRWRGAHLGGGGAAVGRLGRGERTGRSGICLVHLCLCTLDSAVGGQGRGTVRGGVRLCLRPPPPCARRRGPRGHNGATSSPQRREHSPGAADGRTIYYIYACAGARASTFCTGRGETMWITFPWITHCG